MKIKGIKMWINPLNITSVTVPVDLPHTVVVSMTDGNHFEIFAEEMTFDEITDAVHVELRDIHRITYTGG